MTEKEKIIVIIGVLLGLMAICFLYAFLQIFTSIISSQTYDFTKTPLTISKPTPIVLVDNAFSVPAGFYAEYDFYIPKNAKLYISFEVISDGVVDFYVMDEANFLNFKDRESFYYYDYPSRFSARRVSIQWNYVPTGKIYFVWLNRYTTTQVVKAYIVLEE
jgi:glycosidase